MATKFGDNLYAVRREEAKIAGAYIRVLENMTNGVELYTDPFLNPPCCTMVIRLAVKYLGRDCQGDDDEEFYAQETQIQKNVLHFISRGADLLEKTYYPF